MKTVEKRGVYTSNLFNENSYLISSVRPVITQNSGTRYTSSGKPARRSLALLFEMSIGWPSSRIRTLYFWNKRGNFFKKWVKQNKNFTISRYIIAEAGLKINVDKTKILANKKDESLAINRKNIELIEKIKYLGQTITFNKKKNLELNIRIASTPGRNFGLWKKYLKVNFWQNKKVKFWIALFSPPCYIPARPSR